VITNKLKTFAKTRVSRKAEFNRIVNKKQKKSYDNRMFSVDRYTLTQHKAHATLKTRIVPISDPPPPHPRPKGLKISKTPTKIKTKKTSKRKRKKIENRMFSVDRYTLTQHRDHEVKTRSKFKNVKHIFEAKETKKIHNSTHFHFYTSKDKKISSKNKKK
jgi:hypothetical protein